MELSLSRKIQNYNPVAKYNQLMCLCVNCHYLLKKTKRAKRLKARSTGSVIVEKYHNYSKPKER